MAVAGRDSALDPTVAVVVDSRRSEHLLARATILPAVAHWGMPHAVVDLAAGGDLEQRLGRAGVVLLAQEYLGEAIAPYSPMLLRRVQAGGGMVNVDHALHTYPAAHLGALGVEGPLAERSVEAVALGGEHAVTAPHRPDEVVRFKQPLPALEGRLGATKPLLADDGGRPLLVARPLGDGRIVQWGLSPKVWHGAYLGLAHGVDGLLWRSIVWAGPKPFCTNAMPPFVRFRFDDCNGHWREPADLAFVDVLGEHGHIPSICFCLRALTAEGARHASDLQRAGRIDLAPHTLAPATSLFYGDESGEYAPARFRELFAELDEARVRWGVGWSSILSDHEHEWSRHAVPYLRERGIRFKMNITLPGERWTDPHVDWRPGPYGSMSYALDHLPGELGDFFAVFNHHPPSFDSARVDLGGDRFIYHRPGGFGRQKWDFLNGLVHGPDERAKDLDSVVDRVVEHTRIGLDSLFFGGSISHSHFTRHLSTGDWRWVLERARERLAGMEQLPASYDEIAEYAEARAGARLTGARLDGDRLRVALAGASARVLRLSVFEERDGELVRREHEVAPFDREASADVAPMPA